MKSYFYESKPGDWLSSITMKYFGSSKEDMWMRLYNFNKETIGPNPNILMPGTLLWIPPEMALIFKTKEDIIAVDGGKAEAEKIVIKTKSSGFPFMKAGTDKIFIVLGAGLAAFALLSGKKK